MNISEEKRLEIVRSLEILDTPREDRFDVIVERARDLFDVPICVVSIIDADRTWFKACLGLPGRETTRDLSFCDISLRSGQPLVIEDATKDERTRHNPFVTDAPHMRFYAGYPIMIRGAFIGTLCLIDSESRRFDEKSLKMLETLTFWVTAELERTETLKLARSVVASEQRYRQIFDNSNQAILLFDQDGRFISSNRVAQALFAHNQVNGPPTIDRVLGGKAERDLQEALLLTKAGESSMLEPCQIEVRPGQTCTLLVRVTPLRGEPEESMVMVTIEDLTEVSLAADQQKELEAERSRHDAFIAILAHEIRNPLQGIIGAMDILRRRRRNKPDDTLDILDNCSRALNDIVDDTLDLEQIRRGKFKLCKVAFQLESFLDQVVGVYRRQAREKGQTFEWLAKGLDTVVLADRTRLQQIVGNLLSNSVKYTDKGGVIKVTAHYLEGALRLQVADNGIGMSEETLKSLFEPFFQVADGSGGSKMGVGLGLAVVRNLIDAFQGNLDVKSRLGRGSEFQVVLPLEPGRMDEQQPAPERLNLNILIVDDNPINRKILKLQLQNQGAKVQSAGDGQEALELQESARCDLILMDCQMPRIDGYEATRRMRANPDRYGRPIIVALTAKSGEGEKERCLAAGMDDFLLKPVRHIELFAKLERLSSISLENV